MRPAKSGSTYRFDLNFGLICAVRKGITTGAEMSFPIIDTHALIVSEDEVTYPAQPLGGTRSDWSLERSISAPALIAEMDKAGIGHALVLQSSTVYGFDNSYLADSVRQNSARLAGMFSVNVLDEQAPAQMRFWRERGLTAMRIFSQGSTLNRAWLALDDPQCRPAWDCAADWGLCVGTNAANLDQIERILARHPDLRLILEHVTRPQLPEGPPYQGLQQLFALARFSNVYLKITPRTFIAASKGLADPLSYIERLISEFGSDRLMWGSYFPPTHGSLVEILDQARSVIGSLRAADQANIFSGSVRRLFPELFC